MKLSGEPSNWVGLGLLLLLVAMIAMGIRWLNVPTLPV
jgi:hypothetical protein